MAENKVLEKLGKIKPYNIQKGFRYLKHYGFKEFFVRLQERMEPEEVPYGPWYEKHKATAEELASQRKKKWNELPLISVAVPAFHTPPVFLEAMIDSLIAQSYENWELCIVNASPEDASMKESFAKYAQDPRVRVKDLAENFGIGENTNEALSMAKGAYVGLLDHDDVLAPDALFFVAEKIDQEHPDIIYTDEDKIDTEGNRHTQPNLKPDFNIDLLRSNNYICHFLVVKKELIDRAGGFKKGFEGAQDHDFLFRCVEKSEKISHIPRILYHWRTHSASTADNPASKLYAYESGVRAIQEHLSRLEVKAEVSMLKDFGFYKVDYLPQGAPLISIIIPNKDNADTLKRCVDSIFEKSTYKNFEVLIVENNSTQTETFDLYRELEKRENVRILTWENGFNFSAINNFAVREAKGEYLLFLNNDTEVRTPDWLEQLLGNAQRKEVGAVGCRLYYPDGAIQHAGVIIGIGGIAGHAFLNMPGNRSGYLHKAAIQMDLSAVTAACMMVKRSAFESIGGFEEKLTVAFNDVDLCLRLGKEGYLIVYDPFVELTHYESKTRGSEDSPEKVKRFQSEIEFMRQRWITILKEGDPYYNPNLTLSKWNYSLRAN